MNEVIWSVAHTKPRCEKKFASLMQQEAFAHYLPLIQSIRRYGTQKKTFTKPLFPGYVFALVPPGRKARIYQQDLLARAIPVPIYPPAHLSQLEEHVRRHAGILSNAEASILVTVPEGASEQQVAERLLQVEERAAAAVVDLEHRETVRAARERDAPEVVALAQRPLGQRRGRRRAVLLGHRLGERALCAASFHP